MNVGARKQWNIKCKNLRNLLSLVPPHGHLTDGSETTHPTLLHPPFKTWYTQPGQSERSCAVESKISAQLLEKLTSGNGMPTSTFNPVGNVGALSRRYATSARCGKEIGGALSFDAVLVFDVKARGVVDSKSLTELLAGCSHQKNGRELRQTTTASVQARVLSFLFGESPVGRKVCRHLVKDE